MTTPHDLDRDLGAYFEAESTGGAPDRLLDVAMSRIAATSQRPGWLVPERWVPIRTTIRLTRAAHAVAVLGVIAMLIALVIAVATIVGSQRRLPPPFGLARPGLIALSTGGDIYVTNADGTGRRRITGSRADSRPTWSPDGTMIAYETRTGQS